MANSTEGVGLFLLTPRSDLCDLWDADSSLPQVRDDMAEGRDDDEDIRSEHILEEHS